jgi:hypothetical protein
MKLSKIIAFPIGVAIGVVIEAISYICLFVLVLMASPFLIGRWVKKALFGDKPKSQPPIVETEAANQRPKLVAHIH